MNDAALAFARALPLDVTIQYPPRREYFQEHFRYPLDWSLVGFEPEVLLYIHVPFCVAKCHFCNFSVDVRASADLHRRYVDGLLRQLDALPALLREDVRVPGIDIGGGTPTVLPLDDLRRLLRALLAWKARCTRERPFSIETTPAIAAQEPEKMQALVDGGVDRVSVGIQSTNDSRLQYVNRAQQIGQSMRALRHLHEAGFARINADVIFGLPGQREYDWIADLDHVIALAPDSITTYDCLYRGKGRVLPRRVQTLPSPADYGRFYDLAYERLHAAGYHAPYGSVNFAKETAETGTSAYFEGRLLDGLPYVGLGNYAASWFADRWAFAPYGVDAWLRALDAGNLFPVGDAYRLPVAERAAKYALLSLSFGILDPQRFARAVGVSMHEAMPRALEAAVARRWLHWSGEHRQYRMTSGAFGHLPELRALFYTDAVVGWLHERVLTKGQQTA